MLLTEAQARDRQCPLTRDGVRCGAGDCMAWRWGAGAQVVTRTVLARARHPHPPTVDEFPAPLRGSGWHADPDSMALDDDCWFWTLTWRRDTDAERLGYCGLAGEVRHG